MLLERIYDEDLSQASYFIGCQQTNDAIVIDPRRDVQVYLDMAEANGMRIAHVTETHIHADYLSGTRELAQATGATVHLSGEGGADWQYGFDGRRLHDGDTIEIGNLTIAVDHTPGHTPEHLSLKLTDGAAADEPGYLFTGDLVYKGTLAAWFPSTDPEAYLHSLETVAALPVRRVLPGHHALDIQPEIILRMQDAFRQRKAEGTLCHGSGTYDYGDWSVQL